MAINLLKPYSDQNLTPAVTPRHRGSFWRSLLIIFVIVGGLSFLFFPTGREAIESQTVGWLAGLQRLVPAMDRALNGERADRINFLLLGIGGEGHDGPELTDTIIFASFRPSTQEIGLLSIPRDLAVPIPEYDWRKINNINAIGEAKKEGSGPVLASQVISDLLNQKIHYYVKVDFDGFAELIDDLGGINVYIERGFTDSAYPTDDGLTQTIAFEEGWQKMDGVAALQFSRSRHGNNGEGSDFARAARQQKILLAIKDRLLSTSTLLNPSRLNRVLNAVADHLQTNIGLWEIIRLSTYLPTIEKEKIRHHVLDESETSPLYATNINGAYLLLPKGDDWTEVRRIAANVFSETDAQVAMTDPKEETPPFVRLEIQNGTEITGFAYTVSQMLQQEGFEIVKIGNASDRGYSHTVIYDLTDGQKAEELQALQTALQADVSMSAAGWIFTNRLVPTELSVSNESAEKQTSEQGIDFLIILGENTANLVLR